ncbi:aminodeoxychorismate lyase [Sutcliffiella cohnii]
MQIYHNGQIVPLEKATVSVMDHGYMYGVGLFETIKINNRYPFLYKDHLLRLRSGLESVKIKWDFTDDQVLQAIERTLIANNIENGSIRLNVSAGEDVWGMPSYPYQTPTTLIFARQATAALYSSKTGVILSTRRNTPEGHVRFKSHHYLNNLIAYQELQGRKDVEGIFLTKEGYVAEGILTNIFWVKGQKVYTPHVHTGILDGITRRLIIQLLDYCNIKVEEGFYSIEMLMDSDEVFVTNSGQEVLPITEIDDKSFLGTHGEVTKKLQTLISSCPSKLASIKHIKGVNERGDCIIEK